MNAEAKAALSCTLAALAAAMLAGCARKVSVEPERIAWGDPVKGLQAGIEVKNTIRRPEPEIRFTCYVTNTSDKPLRILSLPDAMRRWLRPPLYIKVGGKTAQYLKQAESHVPPARREAYIDLAPGATNSAEALFRPEIWGTPGQFGIRIPFKATVALVYANVTVEHECQPYDPKTKTWAKVTGLWTGAAQSGTVQAGIGRDWLAIGGIATGALVVLVLSLLLALQLIRKRRAKAA